jgi:hypothetical protein
VTAAASLAGVALLGAAAWATIGIAASGLTPTAEAAWPLLAVSYVPIVILSGGFGAVHGEPGWLSTLVGYLPAQPIVDGASRALDATRHGAGMPTLREFAVLLAWIAAGLLFSQRWFRWEPRRKGTSPRGG